MKIIIRPIQNTEKDNREIAALITKILTEEYQVGSEDAGTVLTDKCFHHFGRHYSKFSSLARGYFVAVDEATNIIVGGCGFGPKVGGPAEMAEIQRLFVAKEARGQGLGSRLLDKTLKRMWETGYRSGYLDTFARMSSAIKLYEQIGFEQTEKGRPIHGNADYMMILSEEKYLEYMAITESQDHQVNNSLSFSC